MSKFNKSLLLGMLSAALSILPIAAFGNNGVDDQNFELASCFSYPYSRFYGGSNYSNYYPSNCPAYRFYPPGSSYCLSGNR